MNKPTTTEPKEPDVELITLQEAADRLGVHRSTVYRMIDDGVLDVVRVPRPSRRGTFSRVRAADVDASSAEGGVS